MYTRWIQKPSTEIVQIRYCSEKPRLFLLFSSIETTISFYNHERLPNSSMCFLLLNPQLFILVLHMNVGFSVRYLSSVIASVLSSLIGICWQNPSKNTTVGTPPKRLNHSQETIGKESMNASKQKTNTDFRFSKKKQMALQLFEFLEQLANFH